MANRCDGRKGLFGRCTKEMMHPGDHGDGKTTWSRSASEREVYLRVMEQEVYLPVIDELDRHRAERERLEELARRHEREEL